MSQLNEPQRTIMPRPEGRLAREELPATEDHHSFAPRDHEKLSPVDPTSVGTQKAETTPFPTKRMIDSPQVAIRPLQEDSVFEDAPRSIVELVSLKGTSKPAAVLQPVPTASRPGRIQQFEQTQPEVLQRVVEIHIGRIEVRAASPAAPLKRASQKAATMSLEDYLRSRPGEKP
jgi:hypothetical protein